MNPCFTAFVWRLSVVLMHLVVVWPSLGQQPLVQWNLPPEDPKSKTAGFTPLAGVESELIYDVNEPTDGIYNHHPAIATLGEALVVTWSNHLRGHRSGGEDGPGQQVMWRFSADGRSWSPPATLFPSLGDHGDAFGAGRVVTANGFAHADGALYAIAEVSDNEAKKHGEIRVRKGLGRLARRIDADGTVGAIFWLHDDPPEPLAGYPQFADPSTRRDLADAARSIRRYLDQPIHQLAWDFVKHSAGGDVFGDGKRMVEPTTYRRPDGVLIRLFRDLSNRGYLYASKSTDNGRAWTEPVQTNIPDSPSKTVSGTLPDGRIYLVGNQINRKEYERDPLTLAVSRDGITFDRAWAIRYGAPPIEFRGKGKGRGFQYPSATIVGDEMIVVYTIGKEDVGLSRFPIPGGISH